MPHSLPETLKQAPEPDTGRIQSLIAVLGERDPETRKRILSGLEYLGVKLDPTNLDVKGEEVLLSAEDSKVKVIVVPTDEEMMIARDTFELVK